MAKVWIILLIVILAVIGPPIFRLLQYMKFDKLVLQHQPGPCKAIAGTEHGSEDMEALPNGLVFITNGFKKDHNLPPWKGLKGQVLLYDVNNPDQAATPLTIQGDNLDVKNFNPHGISLWQGKDAVTLFVVNHPPGAETVEVFSYIASQPTTLIHKETMTSEHFTDVNDVVAVGPRHFYLTNIAYFMNPTLQLIEVMLLSHLSNVVFYDGSSSRTVVNGLSMANGINKSPDGKYVYVALMGDEVLQVYERQADNGLTLRQEVKVGPADNIDVDPVSGDLWVAVHPVPHLLLPHIDDPSIPAPAQVLRLKMKTPGEVKSVHEVYSEDGTGLVSGSSVALRIQDKLLIGTIMRQAAICDVFNPY